MPFLKLREQHKAPGADSRQTGDAAQHGETKGCTWAGVSASLTRAWRAPEGT